jgi:hypothetical protein
MLLVAIVPVVRQQWSMSLEQQQLLQLPGQLP